MKSNYRSIYPNILPRNRVKMLFFKLFVSKNMRAKNKTREKTSFSSIISNFQLVFLLPSEVKKTKKNQEACCEVFYYSVWPIFSLCSYGGTNMIPFILLLGISRTKFADAGNKTKTLWRKHHLKIQPKELMSVFLALLTGLPVVFT